MAGPPKITDACGKNTKKYNFDSKVKCQCPMVLLKGRPHCHLTLIAVTIIIEKW